jgi:hypothetical protein
MLINNELVVLISLSALHVALSIIVVYDILVSKNVVHCSFFRCTVRRMKHITYSCELRSILQLLALLDYVFLTIEGVLFSVRSAVPDIYVHVNNGLALLGILCCLVLCNVKWKNVSTSLILGFLFYWSACAGLHVLLLIFCSCGNLPLTRKSNVRFMLRLVVLLIYLLLMLHEVSLLIQQVSCCIIR